MLKVKNDYISTEGIKKIHYEVNGDCRYICITYRFDDENPIKIEVDDFCEYEGLALDICNYVDKLVS